MIRLDATAAAILVLAAGCGSPASDGLDAPGSPVARYDWDPSAGMDALLQGRLVLRDGCLYVGETLAAFPRALASWDAVHEVLTYAGRDYAVGDAVWAGGGTAGSLEHIDIPAACEPGDGDPGTGPEVFLVQDVDLEPYAP